MRWDRFHLASEKRGRNGLLIYRKFVNNATDEEIKAHIYRPQLTLYERSRETIFKVQFSAQKIIFRNSLEEIDEDYFEKVLDALKKSLSEMDVSIEKEILKYGKTMAIHPAKNIPITGGFTARGIIRDFSKVNLTEKMELNEKVFRNTGHGIQFRAETHALTFYDKNKDLEKSEKKAYDTDQTIQQQVLFAYMQQKRKPEVLRMEVRLNDKQKMNSVLQKLGFPKNPTFADIFKREVCQKILLDYFSTYIDPNLFIFENVIDDPQEILAGILRKNKRMTVARAMNLVALKLCCKAEGGVRGLRGIIEARSSQRKWQRTSKDIKTLNRRIPLKSCHSYIKEIKQAIQKFKPYKPETS